MKVTRGEFVGVDKMGEDELRDLAHELLSENAELRKLVKKLLECNGSCPRCIDLMGRCECEEQLKGLGIEVPR